MTFTDDDCFICKGLTRLVELASRPDYRGPKIILCAKHYEEAGKTPTP